jgi:hypothetical protein
VSERVNIKAGREEDNTVKSNPGKPTRLEGVKYTWTHGVKIHWEGGISDVTLYLVLWVYYTAYNTVFLCRFTLFWYLNSINKIVNLSIVFMRFQPRISYKAYNTYTQKHVFMSKSVAGRSGLRVSPAAHTRRGRSLGRKFHFNLTDFNDLAFRLRKCQIMVLGTVNN